MATVSEQFKLAREQQQLDIHQVAEVTKIKTDHIRALESGEFGIFPAPVYIKGFARTYATMLKLDVPRVLAELDTELSRDERFRDHPPLTNSPRSPLDYVMLQLSRLNWRVVIGILLAAAVILIGFTMSRQRGGPAADPIENLEPGVYRPKNAGSGQTLPLPGTAPKR